MKNKLRVCDELVAAGETARSSRMDLLYLPTAMVPAGRPRDAGRPIKNSRPRDKSEEKIAITKPMEPHERP
jgi:hypothetical protein